jgi:hypothetical protein
VVRVRVSKGKGKGLPSAGKLLSPYVSYKCRERVQVGMVCVRRFTGRLVLSCRAVSCRLLSCLDLSVACHCHVDVL